METTQEEIVPFDFKNAEDNDSKNNRIEKIVRGIIKKELIKRLENQSSLFPISNKISIYYIDFYIIKRCYFNASSTTKRAIVLSTKAIHRKEIRRIQKALRTIESNVINELPQELEKRLLKKIILYVTYQWLKKEFYISKQEIRRFVYGFCIFYPELCPKSDPK